jgi:hypothetical protein
MALKVAVIGLAADSHGLAPWGDPAWEKWGLAWDGDWPRLDRTFEMHEPREIKQRMHKSYFGELQHRTKLYMPESYAEVPGSIAYPFDEVAETCGAYWSSSIAYAMALAIHELAEEIGLWGVNMEAADEYGYQRPNMEYLIGLARGRGIKVHIHETSPLLKFVGPPDCDYAGRYGRLK